MDRTSNTFKEKTPQGILFYILYVVWFLTQLGHYLAFHGEVYNKEEGISPQLAAELSTKSVPKGEIPECLVACCEDRDFKDFVLLHFDQPLNPST
jgi:hypothetical protein